MLRRAQRGEQRRRVRLRLPTPQYMAILGRCALRLRLREQSGADSTAGQHAPICDAVLCDARRCDALRLRCLRERVEQRLKVGPVRERRVAAAARRRAAARARERVLSRAAQPQLGEGRLDPRLQVELLLNYIPFN